MDVLGTWISTLKLIVSESACRRPYSQFLSGHKIQPLKQIVQHKNHHVLSAYCMTEHFAVANQYNQPCNTLPYFYIVQFNTQQRGVSLSVKIWKKNIGLAGGAWAVITDVPEPGYFCSPFCMCTRGKAWQTFACIEILNQTHSHCKWMIPVSGWAGNDELKPLRYKTEQMQVTLTDTEMKPICIKEGVQCITVCCYKQQKRRKAQKLAQVKFTKRRQLGRSLFFF